MPQPHVLTEQTRGWLRFLWRKATTPDDWSLEGTPHPWWDRTSTPPMCAFPRFDLGESAYILPVLGDMTPAWREVYTRIADELVGRHTTYWAAIDWNTMIGHDPDQANYPPEWLTYLPERLRGNYDSPGWVANGVKPWGLQPDPIGADGNLFFRGFFNLLLSVYRSVSGDDKWEKPFAVTGYENRRFDWTHGGIAQFIHDQWKERPQGPQCENTKIWPFCLSAAGLGLQLFDRVHDAQLHSVYDEWVDYAQKHYLVKNSAGDMEMFSFCYDPLKDELFSFPDPVVAYAAIAVTPYVLPQAPEFGSYLYEQSVTKLRWNNPSRAVFDRIADPRFMVIGQLIARNLGDSLTQERLRDCLSRTADPRWFGEENNEFGYWFGLDEPYPRGQISSLMMLCETGDPDAWVKAFTKPNRDKYSEPTVEGIDYPAVDVIQAFNGPDKVLHLQIANGTPSRKGQTTTFRITQLPNAGAVSVRCDKQQSDHWRVIDDSSIEIESDNDSHSFEIHWGAGAAKTVDGSSAVVSTAGAVPVAETARTYVPENACSAPCC